MSPAFLVAGLTAVVGAAIHGGAGHLLIVRKLPEDLPSTRFGGPSSTRMMLWFSWHAVTLTFLALGSALAVCGVLGPGDACRGVGVLGATTFSGFVALAVGPVLRRPRSLLTHPGPLVFLVVSGLAWWGTLAG